MWVATLASLAWRLLVTHADAPLTPAGRLRLARCIVDDRWSIRRAAERFQVAPATAKRWADRYRAGQVVLTDRSSRPYSSPNRLPVRTERRIIGLRFTHRWGPHRIGYHLNIPRSTVERVLARYRMPLLGHVDQATGLPLRRPDPHRYEKDTPGELVHVDIKKLGRIPEGGGWRAHGHDSTQARAIAVDRVRQARAGKTPSRGYRYLRHHLHQRNRTHPRLPHLAPPLQSPQTPHRHRRPHTHQPRSQPPKEQQLASLPQERRLSSSIRRYPVSRTQALDEPSTATGRDPSPSGWYSASRSPSGPIMPVTGAGTARSSARP